ncbi:hypothetical protein [Pseudomonas fragi]|uniref:hypothetical protein n=1 Tax=Pseudomonas fragi TaxID=296 RepID=UPI0014753954|nr:hypothetical protein [Pseudomonas fragi]NNB54185.1 hypothetical protein [Pseudomonas fragi]
MSITVKEAVNIALENVSELFEGQSISSVLLEEVDRNPQRDFLITIGFDRPSKSRASQSLSIGLGLAALLVKDRTFKVVCVDSQTGEVKSVKDRILEQK